MSDPFEDIKSVGWDEPAHSTPLADFQALRKKIAEEGERWHRPPTPTLIVSPTRFAWLLEQGYIWEDGTPTEKGLDNVGVLYVGASL